MEENEAVLVVVKDFEDAILGSTERDSVFGVNGVNFNATEGTVSVNVVVDEIVFIPIFISQTCVVVGMEEEMVTDGDRGNEEESLGIEADIVCEIDIVGVRETVVNEVWVVVHVKLWVWVKVVVAVAVLMSKCD